MSRGRRIERRRAKHAAFTLEHAFLFRLSPRVAWAVVLSAMAAAVLMEHLAPEQVWFGPLYLGVMVLAAWTIHPGAALAIGSAILAARLGTGSLTFHPSDSTAAGPNMAVRICGMLIVIGLIGIARRSCQREWRFARTDPLTGAWNRQAFFELIKVNRDTGGWSAMIYADLDGLKRLNDVQGHCRGDEGLRLFARKVRSAIRKGDVFARVGGDEFVIFMHIRDEAAGTAVARRLHQALNTVPGNEDGSFLPCSLGVLVLPDGSKDIDAELRAADELMYEAKKSRCGVVVATARAIEGQAALATIRALVDLSDRGVAVRQADRGEAPAAPVVPPPERSEPPMAA